MDTRGRQGPVASQQQGQDLGTETSLIDLVELIELRSNVVARGSTGLVAMLYVFALLGVVAIIALLGIATSSGWSILQAY